jgi:hypothetical protein
MDFEISDSTDAGDVDETLVVRDLRRAPSISDPIIGNQVLQPEGGPMSVMPVASRTFGGAADREMYVYIDGYGFAAPEEAVPSSKFQVPGTKNQELRTFPETLYHEIETSILDSTGKEVKVLPPIKRGRTSGQIAEAYGLTTQGLAPGRYQLQVSVRDDATDSTAAAGKSFFVVGVEAPQVPPADWSAFTSEEQKELGDIRYVATDRELKYYQSLSDAGRLEYLKQIFWKQHASISVMASRTKPRLPPRRKRLRPPDPKRTGSTTSQVFTSSSWTYAMMAICAWSIRTPDWSGATRTGNSSLIRWKSMNSSASSSNKKGEG